MPMDIDTHSKLARSRLFLAPAAENSPGIFLKYQPTQSLLKPTYTLCQVIYSPKWVGPSGNQLPTSSRRVSLRSAPLYPTPFREAEGSEGKCGRGAPRPGSRRGNPHGDVKHRDEEKTRRDEQSKVEKILRHDLFTA
jgi:hypothetical protein